MIIQCEQCRTKFKLDDEKVSDRGIKVRCAKCRHVFVVRKDGEPAVMAEAITPESIVAPVFEASDETVRMTVAPVVEPEAGSFDLEPTVTFDFGVAPVADSSFELEETDATAGAGFDFGDISFSNELPVAKESAADFGEMTVVMPPKQTVEPLADYGFDFGEEPVQPVTPTVDEAVFDFGDAFTSNADTVLDAPVQKVEFDFGDQQLVVTAPVDDIDMGGFDFGTGSESVVTAAGSDVGSPNLDFSFDDAAPQSGIVPNDGFDFSGVDFGGAGSSSAASTAQIDAFSLGEMDFSGDTVAVKVAAATAPAGALFDPVEEITARQQVTATPNITFDLPASVEEAPPLAITSRRRQSSVLAIVIAVVAIIVFIVLGYIGYSFINTGSKAVSMFGGSGAPAEEGKVTVQNIKAYFISKSVAGELLVITGDALNNYKKPRASLQVKGLVFGSNNQVLATKIAYAGNQLTSEQLATMPIEKIEAAMSNQFGDSLANLEVQPGKVIPFTIVIINPPKDGKDFGVESVGSTVAVGGK